MVVACHWLGSRSILCRLSKTCFPVDSTVSTSRVAIRVLSSRMYTTVGSYFLRVAGRLCTSVVLGTLSCLTLMTVPWSSSGSCSRSISTKRGTASVGSFLLRVNDSANLNQKHLRLTQHYGRFQTSCTSQRNQLYTAYFPALHLMVPVDRPLRSLRCTT